MKSYQLRNTTIYLQLLSLSKKIQTMSFAGHVFDMINRIKVNRVTAKSNSQRFKHVREAYRIVYAGTAPRNNISKLKKEQLELIKRQIRAELKRERQNVILMAILAAIISVLLLSLAIWVLWMGIKIWHEKYLY
jgi:ABC-type multidrug transport system fused ATPase/permease subunit